MSHAQLRESALGSRSQAPAGVFGSEGMDHLGRPMDLGFEGDQTTECERNGTEAKAWGWEPPDGKAYRIPWVDVNIRMSQTRTIQGVAALNYPTLPKKASIGHPLDGPGI